MTRTRVARLKIAALISAITACSCGSAAAPEAPLAAVVNVEFRQSLIGPTKFGGAAWDGPGQLDASAEGELRMALHAVDSYAGVLRVFANPAIEALEKPEPFGRARSVVNGVIIQNLDLKTAQRDTLTPIWQNARLIRVPLTPATRIELELYDKDVINDDAIGAATITYADLVTALRAGTIHHVRVAEQTNNQLLFVDISVEAAP